jgi:outer membrane protein assembly factor BamE (lipoprotein component of BamABCDE complex)
MGKVLLIGGALVAVLMLFVCGGVGIGGIIVWRSWFSSDDEPTASSTTDKDKSSSSDKSSGDKSNADKSRTDKDKQPPPPPQSKVTKANFDRLKRGMTQAEIENILGKPSVGILDGNGNGNLIWTDFQITINIKYSGGKAESGTCGVNGQFYPLPGDTAPGSLVTKANFDLIKGGKTKDELRLLLGPPTQPNAKPDARGEKYVSAQGSAQVWENGVESITVLFNPDGKAAAWKANFIGQGFDYRTDPQYVVKPADAGTKITKDNFNKIKGGLSEFDVAQFLGAPTNGIAAPPPDTANYDKARTQVWQNGADSITVTFCNNKAAYWVGTIGGEGLGPKTDQAFVMLKNATAVTKANYDKVGKGATEAAILQVFGPPTSKSGVTNHAANKTTGVPAHTTYHYKWSDGQGGDMTIHFINFGTGGVVERKEEFRLK